MAELAISKLFDRLIERGGSDLHLTAGYPPMFRLKGELVPEGDQPLTAPQIDWLLQPLLNPHQAVQFATTGDLDFAHAHGTKARFRANYLRKTTGAGAVFRAIPSQILSLDQLGVPAGIRLGALGLLVLLTLQVLLGAQIIWTYRAAAVTTGHVLVGALTLATTFWLTWLAHR